MRKIGESKQLLRIVDANFNRAKEGLRVCEDVTRYGLNRPKVTRAFKEVRHELTQAIGSLKISDLLKARDVQGDVGRGSTASEFKRQDLNDIFYANAQRVKESLRVLEEVTKLLDASCARKIKEMRYKIYALEQKTIKER
jgi:thiamine-phosphate pyrophosphorylase